MIVVMSEVVFVVLLLLLRLLLVVAWQSRVAVLCLLVVVWLLGCPELVVVAISNVLWDVVLKRLFAVRGVVVVFQVVGRHWFVGTSVGLC